MTAALTDVILDLARKVLAAIGGVLIHQGVSAAHAQDLENKVLAALPGALLVALSFIWSRFEKSKLYANLSAAFKASVLGPQTPTPPPANPPTTSK